MSDDTMNLSDEEWKKKLTPDQYKVLREKGTEPAFSGKFVKADKKGMFTCIACGAKLFSSDNQFDSDAPGLAGWPSFSEIAETGAIKLLPDDSYGMHRTEAVCTKCGGHLGHLFDDPSSPTGKHFCINSCAIDLDTQK